jgi:hypothetical protein
VETTYISVDDEAHEADPQVGAFYPCTPSASRSIIQETRDRLFEFIVTTRLDGLSNR